MDRISALLLSGALVGFFSPALVTAQSTPQDAAPAAAPTSSAPQTDAPPATASQLPPAPKGKSTIMGGEIRKVDPVRDVMTLKSYGSKPMKIVFDERTEVYRDGKRIPLRELKPTDHVSVQTTLDGQAVFALSVHILSKSPEGEYQGKVVGYDPGTTELTLSSGLSREPMKIAVPASTPITRTGQPSFTAGHSGLTDLTRGALVVVRFQSDKAARATATDISILATPGAEFVFDGNITSLDTHAGTMALTDPRDDKSYSISFNPSAFPDSGNLRLGQHVSVNTSFDGSSYVARTITAQ